MAMEHMFSEELKGVHCPLCDGAYYLVHLLVKAKKPMKAIVRCNSCGRLGVGTVKVAGSSVPVGEGDVEAMREYLLSFNGDFRALFGS